MNMFKRSRKAKDQAQDDAWDAIARDDTAPRIFKSAKTLRRKKNAFEEEEKPVLDLGNVLPDTDDFRTSLLMPGLSARFSMLREQDDPNTVIGKASDDSVLFPKRASRLNLFGHGNVLSDIAEVESIRSSFRPPFADRDRSNSLGGDGYDSDNGSIMNRSRPGEGNVLFGGRQKLYRIPTTSTKNLTEPESGTITAKHMYEDDVSLSLFQQYRRREKERRDSTEENRVSNSTESDEHNQIQSPSTSFSRNRGTQSSTNSGRSNLRTSTAATSVTSESPVPRDSSGTLTSVPTKLVSESPNASVESFYHQTTSPGLRRVLDEGTQPPRQVSPSKSPKNLRDRSQRSGAIFAASPFRTISPTPTTNMAAPLDFGFDNKENTPTSPSKVTDTSMIKSDKVLARSVQPNDRGKATALGLFNKPAKEFDEQQYSQRQVQMHEGRGSPFSNTSRSASIASNDARPGLKQDPPVLASPGPDGRNSNPQIPPIPTQPVSPVSATQRASRASNTSTGRGTPPRPRSKSSASATAKDNVKARVESLIRRQNAELAALEAEKMAEKPKRISNNSALDKEMSARIFDEDDNEIIEEEREQKELERSATNSIHVPDSDIHPAFRSEVIRQRRSNNSNFSKPLSIVDDTQTDTDRSSIPIAEDNAGLGLSGLIRTHLRHDSDRSSFMRLSTSEVSHGMSDRTPQNSTSSLTKAVTDEARNDQSGADTTRHLGVGNSSEPRPISAHTAMSQKAQQMLEHATRLRDAVNCTVEESKNDKALELSTESDPCQDDKEPSHRRGESSETTKERREFDEELAERRRRIQEGLRSVTERERSTSPIAVRGRDLRMEAFAHPSDSPDKIQSVRPGLESKLSDEHRGRNTSSRQDHRGPTPDYFSSNRQRSAHSRQENSDLSSQSRSITPSSGRPAFRERSNSEFESRSRGRNRPAYDFQPSIPGNFPMQTSLTSQPTSPMPAKEDDRTDIHPVLRSASAMSTRMGLRSTSSPVPHLAISHGSQASPRPSPISPMSPYMQSPNPGYSSGRSTPLGSRKRSGTKTQISGPTFISSTSSQQLVPLHNANVKLTPPLPEMNPRRRGNTLGEKSHPTLNFSNLARSPLATVPASPRFVDAEFQEAATASANESISAPRMRPRLRKSSSEGGNLASKARQQAIMTEIAHEKNNSPAVPVFPNRSATSLGLSSTGNMF